MIVNQAALKSIFVGFKTIFNRVLQQITPQYTKIATIVDSKTKTEQYKWIDKIPRIREWIGDREIQNLSASDYEIKNKTFESTIGVDREDIEDDTLGIYPPLVESLSQSAATYPDELCFELIGNGFDNKCYDGKAFFATDHKLGKVTVVNKGTKKLTPDNYGAARAQMMSMRDGSNKSLKITPSLLVVPPQLEGMARKILLSDTTAVGETNIYKGSAELLVAPELSGDPNAWFLLDVTKPLKPIIYQNRKNPTIVSLISETDTNVFMNKQYLYGVDFRCNAGYGLWQLAYGSTGADAS